MNGNPAYRLCRDIIARMAVEDGRRVDGRARDQLREITCETGLHPPLHGSALFQRGQTQVGISEDHGLKVCECHFQFC